MSGTSTPTYSSIPLSTSRTIAIIKGHALKHRFEVEARITSYGFEIIKERQMGFMNDDPNVYALFGDDAPSLSGEPVWVYVLERRRAVEVWNSLMGDEDPDVARVNSPDSIRSLFGVDRSQNAVYGSPDAEAAELQIASLFASSPPFPPVEMHDEAMAHLNLSHHAEDDSSDDEVRVDIKSKTAGFKARPVPVGTYSPSVQPRTTRAAALRAGLEVATTRTRPTATPESIAQTFANVPGHKRALALNVPSTAAPSISPRQTRASALRTGQAESPSAKGIRRHSVARQPTSEERVQEIFANIPGHKRRETIAVASTAPPSVAPRATRSSSLRTGEPLTSPPRRSTLGASVGPGATFEGVPGHKRTITLEVPSVRPPTSPPKTNRSALLRQQKQEQKDRAPPSSWGSGPSSALTSQPKTPSRPASQTGLRSSQNATSSTTRSSARSASVEPTQPRTTPAAVPRTPSITPRTNRSALLRAKMGTTGTAPRVAAF